MKTFVSILLTCLVCSTAFAAPRAAIVIHPIASVSGDYFVLSDIATVTCADTTLRVQLMDVQMGRCPLPGLTRDFNEGDVTLKLRQAGIDPETLTITGATDLTILGSNNLSTSAQAPVALPSQSASTVLSTAPGPRTVLIHPGDNVTLVYDSDGMVISASVVAMSPGGVGDTIELRRDGAEHPLSGVVQDSQTVRMVE